MPPFCPSLRILRASISMGSAVNGAPPYGVARPVAHARAAEASAGVTNNPPRSFVSGDELTYPTRTGSTCRDSNSRARSKSGAVGTTQTSTLETEFCGQRLSTARTANEPQRRRNELSRPTGAVPSRGNVVLFCGLGNHVNLRGIRGGRCRDRTCDPSHVKRVLRR
jgi:hypothetical protein